MISANTSCAAPSGALTVVNERREDYLGLPKVGNACARAVACVRALGDGSVTPNPAVNVRGKDRALKIKGHFRARAPKPSCSALSRLSSLAKSCGPLLRLRT
jgi:hypothetical protein